MKIKANEELFNSWINFSSRDLAGIVQNDMEITEEQLREWDDRFEKRLFEFTRLRNKTVNYIRRG